jgi:hypothetical protein
LLFKLIKNIFIVYFLYSEKLRSWRWPDHRLKILFSCKPDWEPRIRKGFLFTGHQIYFKNFSAASLNDYDLVVPLTYEDLDFLNTAGFQSDRCWLPRPSSDVAHLCHDKFKFILKANELGFYKNIPKIVAHDKFPLVLKRKTDTWGKNTHIVKDASEYASLIQSINTDDYFHQELILGAREFATHVVFIGSMPFCVELDITGSDALARCIWAKRQAPADCWASA